MGTKLTNYDPFSEFWRADPFHAFDHLLEDFRLTPALRNVDVEPRIRMDVSETDQAYTVKAEIPGVKKEDIKVDIEGKQVSISAESKQEAEEKSDGKVVRSERYYGQQYRSFTLPCEIDEARAEATYRDGVLELTLPKKAGSVSHKLAVS